MPIPNQNNTIGCLLASWLPTTATLGDDISALVPSSFTLDSRAVVNGSLFAAVKGHQVDGRRFIDKAIAQGALAVLAEAEGEAEHGEVRVQQDVPVIYFSQLNLHLSAIAKVFYQQPDEQLKLVAVTGTNGKTTISQILAQWAELVGYRSGVMGTTGNGLLSNLVPAANTTGSAIEIQHVLADLYQQGASFAAMEVSSHGLVQGRVKALHFAASIFTNLSRDHLDYHGDMASYAAAKQTLFTEHHAGVAVINMDDEVGCQWLKTLPDAVAVTTQAGVAAKHQGPRLWLTDVAYSTQGVTLSFDSSWGAGSFTAPLVGSFNVMNIMLALATLLATGHDIEQLIATAPQLKAVIGRMEVFQKADKPLMVVDYAHTPDALEKALQALQVHCDGKLWCIFGCGGDRDTGKRPMMAAIAEQHADQIILTDDNPRSENPESIMNDMKAGLVSADQARVIHDRFSACQYALTHAAPQDIVLVAGKGHEDYQILADRTIHYSDRETVQTLLETHA
ncbi:UDP-N-acetylmuramoyl-L-alanyl-D-glutamate--2,6-diaminopimelate ligase [Photobacterium kagoshimensis]|uniref:UDP-N-acetylmuramoyl-L-alanyl-D-glutamate--2, 6-diaminopimelate ligase n=1 Tax=Photobacterium kagoshimensis TaxID=2910242 RepID=UPI003D0D209C